MNLYTRLIIDEGALLNLYVDSVGKHSIGIGRNLSDRGIRPDEMELMFRNDVKEAKSELLRNHPWVIGLDEPRREVLINMVFNMGITTFNKFVNTLANVKKGNYTKAAVEMLDSKWARQVGPRATRLAKQMETGRRV